MARVAGTNIPNEKRVEVGLTYIYGIGDTSSKKILDSLKGELAAHGQRSGVAAIAAIAPYYFKPRNVESLVDWCSEIAAAASGTPFYFYDVPALTHVNFPMPAFLEQAAARIPTLNGIKFTNNDLMAYQLCLQADSGAYDIPWGIDECMLAAMALGGTGAVGSTYNFAAPVFHRILASLEQGDIVEARAQQRRGTALIQLLFAYGYLGASKVIMKWLGVDVGRCRQPMANPSQEQILKLRQDLEVFGFFDKDLPGQPGGNGAPSKPRAVVAD